MIFDQVHDLELQVDRAEVRRYLGYPRSKRPRPRVQRRFEEIWEQGHALMRPRGACRVVEDGRLATTGMPRATPRVAVAVCTVGGALEDESRRRGDRGAVLDAMLLDAFGSAAAEAAADALNGRICVWANGQGLHPAPRISPGYGRWDVKAQADLLRLLPAGDVGVRLTPSLMLVPHKSVSFAVRFPEKPPAAVSRAHKCQHCGLLDCPYREAPHPRPHPGHRMTP